MGANSNIEWTDHTFNPWIGCTKVSPGCLNCYAATQDNFRKWTPEGWGAGKPRKRTSESNWKGPVKWNRDAAKASSDHAGYLNDQDIAYSAVRPEPKRPRVFCASLADWLDDEVPIEWLADLLRLVYACPNLDWLLLSKRPQNWRKRLTAVLLSLPQPTFGQVKFGQPPSFGLWLLAWLSDGQHVETAPPSNVWIGITVEDQTRADERIPQLVNIPARVRFLSCEPLLGKVDLNAPMPGAPVEGVYPRWYIQSGIHWVICGAESGGGRRAMQVEWAHGLRDQCSAAGVAFFMKQMEVGRQVVGDIAAFPADLQERAMPL